MLLWHGFHLYFRIINLNINFMATTTEISSVLKDLVQINVDRYNGCQKALEDVHDSDLKDMFRRMGEHEGDARAFPAAGIRRVRRLRDLFAANAAHGWGGLHQRNRQC